MTHNHSEYKSHAEISTHTLTWSVTQELVTLYNVIYNFNSHAHVERDKLVVESIDIIKYFNSHAHVERDLGH